MQYSCTVLIADDDESIRNALEDMYVLDGYNVIVAKDGQEALDLIKQGPRPLLALIDIRMPKLDGIGVIKEIMRSQEKLIDVVAMTASQNINIHGITMVYKPFDLDWLMDFTKQRCDILGQLHHIVEHSPEETWRDHA